MKTQFVITTILSVISIAGNSQSPLTVSSTTGQSVINMTSDVYWGAMLKLQRSNNSGNSYAFETGAGNNDDLRLHVNNGWSAPIMAFKTDGSVGIGTASTSYKLDVAGSVGTTNLTINHPSGNSQIYFKNAGATEWDFGTQVGEATQNFNIYNRGTSSVAFSVNKNLNYVGIGTTTPNQKLSVVGNQSVTGDVWVGTDGGGISTISGPASSGAIQIKTHSGLGGVANRYLRFGWKDNNSVFTPVLSINDDQNVGIGTTSPQEKLHVVGNTAIKGQVHANEVKVDLNVPGPDYVFEKEYKLTSLEEIKNYIDQNKHLPEVPSAKDMEKNGVQLGEMNMLLLKKIEELTLHVIDQNKRMNEMQTEHQHEITELKKLLKEK